MVYCRDLLARVKVVEDAPSDRAMNLELGGKIKPRSKVTILYRRTVIRSKYW